MSSVEPVASNVHVKSLQSAVNAATGGASSGGGGTVPIGENRSRLAVPPGTPDSASAVASPTRAAATSAGVAFGFSLRYRAAAPVTCGEDIDVPLRIAASVSLRL